MMLSTMQYLAIHGDVFHRGYTGYRPEVREAPNGDGKIDSTKRFAHVAMKYSHADQVAQRNLDGVFMAAYRLSQRVARALGIPAQFAPSADASCLRVLEYPAGADSHAHTDFNLFTLMLYRNQPDKFWMDTDTVPAAVRNLNEHCHLGELSEIIGFGKATEHGVYPSDTTQRSIVFFALPAHGVQLPTGQTVGEWVADRVARSRY